MRSTPSRRSRWRATSSPARRWRSAAIYLKKRDFTGAINRFKVVVTQYQTTRHVEEALERLTEAYMALGIVDEAQTAAAVLGHNFPDSPWYKDAYRLVKSAGGEPPENKGSWISRAFEGRPGLTPPAVTPTSDGRRQQRIAYDPLHIRRLGVSVTRCSCWPGSRSATSS